ncbi:zinc-dependent metalloprotease [Taibaiella soli]|uniref:Zinc metalloprotease n=1 Tax=Taibaiella soli TaxID=1649169 RepID=A0A2W2AB48_9BACT|nr:zinc-dependent metalloprotease [Taibaiella soli]PZF72521.1 hypothetical protein DN068_11695 [Taibaiella soli]
MKKTLLMAAFLGLIVSQENVQAQEFKRNCGFGIALNKYEAKDPSFREKVHAYQAEQVAQYQQLRVNGALERGTGISPIPVIFHIVVDSALYNQMGGATGIANRVNTQMDVLNRDFNRQNADSSQIPAVFKTVYGNANIQFGLAHRQPDGTTTPGYEIKIVSSTVANSIAGGSNSLFSAAKYSNQGGLDAWDNTKYLNVWVTKTGANTGNVILGVTVPQSSINYGQAAQAEKGIVLSGYAIGVQSSATNGQTFISGITGGRTLTHEMGHFFEIWHVWGDDNGRCPGHPGGHDDDIADTPPQADATYGNPTFPLYDSCSAAGTNGIMFMNYMDYVNDNAMHIFTNDQIINMQASLNGENYTLTQHPELLAWPTAVTNVEQKNNFDIYPNPTTGSFNISFNGSGVLKAIHVLDMMGKNVQTININNQQNGIYPIDLSGMSKGIYFVQCQFDEGVISRKIVLQ